MVIVVNCIIGLLAGSCFGIFFSGEDNGSGQTMPAVVREINEEYETRLVEIKAANSHDVLEMAAWREVLAIYAVKTSTDPINPQEVATLDDGKKQLLKVVFLQMNEISHSTSTQTETVVIETDDGHGNIVETETIVTRTTLYITAGHKTVDEMAEQFGFNEEQKQQLAELLAVENAALWTQVLYGICRWRRRVHHRGALSGRQCGRRTLLELV